MKLHPEVLRKNGRNEFVVLPWEEFVQLQDMLEDARDVLALRQAKDADAHAPTIGMEDLQLELETGDSPV